MAKKSELVDLHSSDLLTGARAYYDAATVILDKRRNASEASGRGGARDDPIYFLLFHAMELALKAFLLSYNQSVQKTHDIKGLYEQCCTLGLRIGPEDRFSIGNVVTLLKGANKQHGLRYFAAPSRVVPELSWTCEVVEQLLQTIAPGIEARSQQRAPRNRGLILTMTMEKPKPKTRA